MVRERTPDQRVVVTGLGAVSANGIGVHELWPNLLSGRSAVSPVEGFDLEGHPVRIGAQVKDFVPATFIARERLADYGRTSQLAIAATKLALADAGLDVAGLGEDDLGIFVGTTMGECDLQEEIVRTWVGDGIGGLAPARIAAIPDSSAAFNIARELDCRPAHCLVFPTACAAANYAIGYGGDQIQLGRRRVIVAGGSDAFSIIAFTGFGRMLALAHERCQPFDKNRGGIVIGEGSGMLVLESMEHALARNARIYAELRGYGLSCDAYHMTIPQQDGAVAVMNQALRSADVGVDEVGYISAHGTGTHSNDKSEAGAIHRVFGARANRVPVSSIKSMLGHAMGAASALEAIACVMAIHDSKIPPTINYETPDEECDLDCVPNVMRQARVDVALNNAFAFGANNAATVFARWS